MQCLLTIGSNKVPLFKSAFLVICPATHETAKIVYVDGSESNKISSHEELHTILYADIKSKKLTIDEFRDIQEAASVSKLPDFSKSSLREIEKSVEEKLPQETRAIYRQMLEKASAN